MGNWQSSLSENPERRPPNRLSKLPADHTPAPPKTSLISTYADVPDSTAYTHPSLWPSSAPNGLPTVQERPIEQNHSPGSAINSSPLDECSQEAGVNDEQAEEEQSSASIFRGSWPKRRFSIHDGAIGKRLSLNMGSKGDDMSTPTSRRRATVPDMAQLLPAPQTSLGETVDYSENKRYSAFRRHSLRTPGIATRVDDSPSIPNPVLGHLDYNSGVTDYEDQMASNTEISGQLQIPIRNNNRELSPIRAASPYDEDYSYLGGLMPGSLHVVNGCASPTPSALQPDPLPETSLHQPSRESLRMLSLNATSQSIGLQETPQKAPSFPTPRDGKPGRSNTRFDKRAGQTKLRSSHMGFSSVPGASWLDLEMDDSVPPPTFIPQIEVPKLAVTSKHTAAEDDLFDDEAIDIPTSPEFPADTAGDRTSKRFKNRTSKPKPPQEQEHHDQTQNKPRNLYKSDSGYSSTSSKITPPSPPCDFSKQRRKTYDPSYAQRTISDGDAFAGHRNNWEAGTLVSSTAYDKRSGEFTDGFTPGSTLTRTDDRPKTSPDTGRERNSQLDATPREPQANNAPSRRKSIFKRSPHVEPWVTYRPDWWPLKGDLTMSDKPGSGPPRVYRPVSMRKESTHSKKTPKRKEEGIPTNSARKIGGPLSSHPVALTPIADTSKPHPPLPPPASSRLSLPATPRRHHSTINAVKSDEQPVPEKYISRIKSLVVPQGRQQQRGNTSVVDDEDGQPQQWTAKGDTQKRRLSRLRKVIA